MLKLLSVLIVGKKKLVRKISEPKKGVNFKAGNYDPQLVPTLVAEHQGLIEHYMNILAAAEKGRHKLTKHYLIKFRLELTTHLLKENHLLYAYMKTNLKDPMAKKKVTEFKSEMDRIGNEVLKFIYAYTRKNATIDDDFVFELKAIGKALTSRIANEEQNLYPLYNPVS